MATSGASPEGKSEVQSQGKSRIDVPTVFGGLSIALGGASAVLGILLILYLKFDFVWPVVLMAFGGLILGGLGMRARRLPAERGYQLSRAGAVLNAVVGLAIPLIGLAYLYYVVDRWF